MTCSGARKMIAAWSGNRRHLNFPSASLRETQVDAKPVTGTDVKTGDVEGVRNKRIAGDNVRAYRERVRRVRGPGSG